MRAPLPRRAAARAGEVVDRAFLRLVLGGPLVRRRATHATPGGPSGEAVLRRLEEGVAFYEQARDQLFPEPPPVEPATRLVQERAGGDVVDLTWQTGWRALHPSYAALMRWCTPATVAAVRWFRHHRPAPAVICVHGWGAGHFALETRAWRARTLYAQGLDVLLYTLPLHAARLPPGRTTPMFPHPDPFRTNEAFAQAILELRGLMRYLRGRGAPAVGVAGMSLGGYTTALLATVEPDLDFALPIIPVACIADLMWQLGVGSAQRREAEALGLTVEGFTNGFAATSALARAPAVPGHRMVVMPGARDRVVPAAHARMLAEHFAAPVRPFPGCHLVQVGRDELFEGIAGFLRRGGVLP